LLVVGLHLLSDTCCLLLMLPIKFVCIMHTAYGLISLLPYPLLFVLLLYLPTIMLPLSAACGCYNETHAIISGTRMPPTYRLCCLHILFASHNHHTCACCLVRLVTILSTVCQCTCRTLLTALLPMVAAIRCCLRSVILSARPCLAAAICHCRPSVWLVWWGGQD
jgi:hypothetical protein